MFALPAKNGFAWAVLGDTVPIANIIANVGRACMNLRSWRRSRWRATSDRAPAIAGLNIRRRWIAGRVRWTCHRRSPDARDVVTISNVWALGRCRLPLLNAVNISWWGRERSRLRSPAQMVDGAGRLGRQMKCDWLARGVAGDRQMGSTGRNRALGNQVAGRIAFADAIGPRYPEIKPPGAVSRRRRMVVGVIST